MRAFWPVASLSVLLMSVPAAAKEHNVRDGGIYLGVDYFTGTVDSGMHDFLYLVPGFTLDLPKIHFDIRSQAIILIPDGIIGAMRYLATGNEDIPLWSGLNDGDENPGNLRMLESEFRYTLLSSGKQKLDVGGLFDVWWMNPFVEGTHFGNVVWNVGPSVGWGFRGSRVSSNISLNIGNGFSDWGAFNPFFGIEAFVRVQLTGILGLYARVLTRSQNYDYSGFESNDTAIPPETFDIRKWEFTLSIDGGLMLGLW